MQVWNASSKKGSAVHGLDVSRVAACVLSRTTILMPGKTGSPPAWPENSFPFLLFVVGSVRDEHLHALDEVRQQGFIYDRRRCRLR